MLTRSLRFPALTGLCLPRSDPKNANGRDLAGNALVGAGEEDAAQDAVVAALYGSAVVTDRIFLGLGLNAPFGRIAI